MKGQQVSRGFSPEGRRAVEEGNATLRAIDLKPTPEAYAMTLIAIITRTESHKDRTWAVREIVKAFEQCAAANPEAWASKPGEVKPS
jgi:hypothetical protein